MKILTKISFSSFERLSKAFYESRFKFDMFNSTLKLYNFESFVNTLNRWQKRTFPGADKVSKLHHLKEEVNELINALENSGDCPVTEIEVRKEYADCFMLLFGSALDAGFTFDEIVSVMKEKFEIVKKRKWGAPDKYGVIHHIKE